MEQIDTRLKARMVITDHDGRVLDTVEIAGETSRAASAEQVRVYREMRGKFVDPGTGLPNCYVFTHWQGPCCYPG